jgi:hypothetical protein
MERDTKTGEDQFLSARRDRRPVGRTVGQSIVSTGYGRYGNLLTINFSRLLLTRIRLDFRLDVTFEQPVNVSHDRKCRATSNPRCQCSLV